MRYALTGLSIADTSAFVQTYEQLGGLGRGGTGVVRNTALAFAGHVNGPRGGPWRSIEFVSVDPVREGVESSVGLHQQRTHEIYFVTEGLGVLETNGEAREVGPGLLAIAPKGTWHTIRNPSATEALGFIVVELRADEPDGVVLRPNFVDLAAQLREGGGFYPVRVGRAPVSPLVAAVDLAPYFPDSCWGALSLVKLPASARVDEYVEADCDQLLFVMEGVATITLTASRRTDEEPEDADREIRVDSSDEGHQSVLVPRGVPRQITNRASGDAYPLTLFCLSIRREEATGGTDRATMAQLANA